MKTSIRHFIRLVETASTVNGKFWFDTGTQTVYPIDGVHHAVGAFRIPALCEVLRRELGDRFESVEEDIWRSYDEWSGERSDEYVALNEIVCDILLKNGIARCNNVLDRVMNVEMVSVVERKCLPLLREINPETLYLDFTDTGASYHLWGSDLDRYLRGRLLGKAQPSALSPGHK